MLRKPKIERFNDSVLTKYQIYNSIFLTLPFDEITNTGVLLPLFSELCEQGYEIGKNPTEILADFFSQYYQDRTIDERNDLLFRFIQYIERQVVLFDAVEDAAFAIVNNLDGKGTLRDIKENAEEQGKALELKKFLSEFKIRTVLTAHPTQFYPGTVLGIITDLTQAIKKDNFSLIKKLLAQLGKTPFFNKQQPTPYEEAVNLIWFLENVFYHSASKIYQYLQTNVFDGQIIDNQIVMLGFWPGGDRDGNPNVNSETTLKVAERLKTSLLRSYYRDIRKLKRRITFDLVDHLVQDLEQKLYQNSYQNFEPTSFTAAEFLRTLLEIRDILQSKHQSLFIEDLDELISKVKIFGFYFASLDIRQDSRIHQQVIKTLIMETQVLGLKIFPEEYSLWSDKEKIEFLTELSGDLTPDSIIDEIAKDTLASLKAMRLIQKQNGELGANRYIISNTQSALNVMEVLGLMRLVAWEQPTVDIIPLFETIEDLQKAEEIMTELYANKFYAEHLLRRGKKQTIMLGFSDGTKDGGYLMANWSIYRAKEMLTKLSRKYQVDVFFFDGRGGPPARGGGKTHQFYASQGSTIENKEIQLTIQGQTISSNFGNLDSCQYNLEQLLSAGIVNQMFSMKNSLISSEDQATMQELAELSYQAYQDFKDHPKFMPYLEERSTLKYYAKTNISSRPAKRGNSNKLNFEDLRAIPFVGSWSQLKQNVPGYYGVGLAIENFKNKGELERVEHLFKNSAFFRTLLENTMMSLTKSFFPLTAHLNDDPEFGSFWSLIHEEYLRTKKIILELFSFETLMENTKAVKASIDIREKIVLPLVTIQQFALGQVQSLNSEAKPDQDQIDIYEKMITRTLFGNINASRNSA